MEEDELQGTYKYASHMHSHPPSEKKYMCLTSTFQMQPGSASAALITLAIKECW